MLTERFPIETTPAGGFVYVLHFEDSNYVMLGLGHESTNGLQLTHVTGIPIHGKGIHEIADAVNDFGFSIPTGRLAPYFAGEPDHVTFTANAEGLRAKVAAGLRKLHDAVWGHPLGQSPEIVDMLDGRFVWVIYDSEIDKVKIGIGFVNESNEHVFGDPCYAIGVHYAAEFTTEAFIKPISMYFFSIPPRWPSHFPRITDADETKKVMTAVVQMADKAWGADKVNAHIPKPIVQVDEVEKPFVDEVNDVDPDIS